MMRFSGYMFALFILCLGVPLAAQASSGGVEGFWLTENKRSVIEITPCQQGLCGYVHWIVGGGMQYDSKNPDVAQRDTPMCGLGILWGFKQESPTSWTGGKIYKADDGDTYDANVQLQSDGTLRVRGYVGVSLFGKTQTWNRVEKSDYAACTPPKS
jgi:uncharacterized protein (DUF2147 family)